MSLNLNHKLSLIIILGLILRIAFNLVSGHIFHPDEIFQTLEPAYKLVYGYGLEPWDFTYGLRSWLTPYFLSLPLLLYKGLGFTHPSQYVKGIEIFLSVLSLSIIPALYLLTKQFTNNRSIPLLAAFYGAVWYELIYFAPRALTEVFAVYLFSVGLIALFSKKPKFALAAFFLSLGTLLRPQYFFIPILFLYVGFTRHLNQSKWVQACIGAGLGFALYGIVDWYTLGAPFISLANNFKLSFLSGISREFGVSPWYYYFQAILITSCGLVFVLFRHPNPKKKYLLYLAYAAILLIHTLIPHKEYRFIFILIPLLLCLIALATSKISALLTTIVCLISVLGILGRLPYQFLIYRFTPLARDSLLLELSKVPTPPRCGLYLPDRGWVTSGGYYRLGANLPIYTFDYPPPASGSAKLIIAPRPLPPEISPAKVLSRSPGFSYLTPQGKVLHPGYLTLDLSSNCAYDAQYSYLRSFAYLKPYLIYAKTYPTP